MMIHQKDNNKNYCSKLILNHQSKKDHLPLILEIVQAQTSEDIK